MWEWMVGSSSRAGHIERIATQFCPVGSCLRCGSVPVSGPSLSDMVDDRTKCEGWGLRVFGSA